MQTTQTKVKYIMYCRKSTENEDRQLLSLNDQKKALEELEHRENLHVVQRFAGAEGGESRSAFKRGRPIFNQIMRQIEAGKANGLLVWHANRIARNAFDGGWVITAMDERTLVEVKTPHRTYRNTPDDKFFLQLEFGIAKKYSDDSSVAVKRGLDSKAEMGWRPGFAPLGYLNTKTQKGANEVVNDPERYELVKRAWQMLLTGNYTVPQVIHIAWRDWRLATRPTAKHPSKPVARSSWYRIFTNPFYSGWYEFPQGTGAWHQGKHDPMVTEEEYDRVQLLLGRKGKPRPKRHIFAFTGLMRCASCGARITAEEKVKRQKNGNVHRYLYYHCTKRVNPDCPERSIELSEMHRQIDCILAGLTISDKFFQWAIRYLHEVRTAEARSQEVALESKHKALATVSNRLDNLLLKYTSPENAEGQLLTDREYRTLKIRFLKEKAGLERQVRAHGQEKEEWLTLSEKTFNFVRHARLSFAHGDMETKRAIFACLGSNLLVKDKKVLITLREPFKSIFEGLQQAEEEISQVRTSKNGGNKGYFAEIMAKCPMLQRVVDDVRTYFLSGKDKFFIPSLPPDANT